MKDCPLSVVSRPSFRADDSKQLPRAAGASATDDGRLTTDNRQLP
jgi:hypothetical protein